MMQGTLLRASADERGGEAPDRDERIKRRAYEIWEREGRPSGRDVEHWREAEAEIVAEDEGDRAADDAAGSLRKSKP
jgi:hypothetical protein